MSNVTQTASKALPISVGAVTEIGVREENQDNMTAFSSPWGAVYVVADGMGGHQGGAEASRMVTDGIQRNLLSMPPDMTYAEALNHAAQLTNLEVVATSRSGDPNTHGMGSTIVVALVRESNQRLELITAHAGDSRAYLHRGTYLKLLTRDHTQVQWLIESHAIDEEQARNHPDASVLTRAVGHVPELTLDVSEPIELGDSDGVLLCSDGLSGFASSDQINETIQHNPDPNHCASELVRLALSTGSNDNITVQFLRIGSPPRAVSAPLRRGRKTEPEMGVIDTSALPHSRGSLPKGGLVAGFKLWQLLVAGILLGALLAVSGIYAVKKMQWPPYRSAGKGKTITPDSRAKIKQDTPKIDTTRKSDKARTGELGKSEGAQEEKPKSARDTGTQIKKPVTKIPVARE